jgi:hypothetical protein
VISVATIARIITPPITPPIIAPVFELFEPDGVGEDVWEPEAGEPGEVVVEALGGVSVITWLETVTTVDTAAETEAFVTGWHEVTTSVLVRIEVLVVSVIVVFMIFVEVCVVVSRRPAPPA